MKLTFLTCVGVAFGLVACEKPSSPLPTVATVDLQRYAGTWNEITRLPHSFQRDDSRATAEYTAKPDGSVGVKNTEFRPDGSQKSIEGTATPVAGSNNARLQVRFGGLASLAPVPKDGNYWVIALKDDYSAAMVGTPDRKFLWILARERTMKQSDLDAWIAKAKSLGFPTEKLLPPRS